MKYPFSSCALALALTYVLASVGCKRNDSAAGGLVEGGDDGAPVPVEVVAIERGPIEDALTFSTTLAAEVQVQVLARTVGQVQQRLVEEGDRVQKGQVLLRLESEEQASALRRTKAELAQAERNYDARAQLAERGAVSTEVLENSKLEVQRLTIARDDAARNLRYTTVRAPIGGVVTRRLVKRGDLVNPNQQLFEIADFESLIAEVYVPEKFLPRLTAGGQARLLPPSGDTILQKGVVERIAPVVDAKSGTVKVTVDLPDTEGLRPGMFVEVELVVAERPDAILLPRRALVYDNDQPFAFKIVDGSTVARVRVVPEVEDREHVVPASGFAPGDRVVVAGQVGLKDGAKVAIKDGLARAESSRPVPRTEKPAAPAAGAAPADEPGEKKPAKAEKGE